MGDMKKPVDFCVVFLFTAVLLFVTYQDRLFYPLEAVVVALKI